MITASFAGQRRPLTDGQLLRAFLTHPLLTWKVTFGIHWSTAFSSALIMACSPVFTLLILHWAGIEANVRQTVDAIAAFRAK